MHTSNMSSMSQHALAAVGKTSLLVNDVKTPMSVSETAAVTVVMPSSSFVLIPPPPQSSVWQTV